MNIAVVYQHLLEKMNDSKQPPSTTPNTQEEFNPSIIREFLANISFDLKSHPEPHRDSALEAAVTSKLSELGFSTQTLQPLTYLVPTCCMYASLAHSSAPMDLKVFIASYMTLAAGIDDSFLDASQILSFTLNFAHGKNTHGHPHLDCLMRLLTIEAPRFFGPLAVNFITSSTIDAINGFLLESKFSTGFSTSIPGFAAWMRHKGGYGEVLTFFIFPDREFPEDEWLGKYIQTLPITRDVICYINDILSFYKEQVLKKESCFIENLAQEKGCGIIAALRETCVTTAELRKRVRERFAVEDEKLSSAFDSYIEGYVKWHFSVKRYRLDDIGLSLGQ